MTNNKEQQVKPAKKQVISPLALKNELNELSNEELFIKISNLDEEDRKKTWTLLSDKKCAEILESSGSPLEWFNEMSVKKESGVISVMDEEKATDASTESSDDVFKPINAPEDKTDNKNSNNNNNYNKHNKHNR